MAQTGKNKWFFLPHLLSASVYYSAKPADRWRLILANVKEWISVPYLSLLISQPEAQAGLFWAWQVYASSPDSKTVFLHHYRKPLKDIIRDRMYCCCFANISWLRVLVIFMFFLELELGSLTPWLVWKSVKTCNYTSKVPNSSMANFPRHFGFNWTWVNELCCPFLAGVHLIQ